MPKATLLVATLLLGTALVVLAAPSATAHVCIEGWRVPGCDDCPDLGLFHWHPDEVAGIRFAAPICVLP